MQDHIKTIHQHRHWPVAQYDMQTGFALPTSGWHLASSDEHSFMETIRNSILQYRLQSPAHYDVEIYANQVLDEKNPKKSTKLSPSFKITIGLHTFGSAPLICSCRPEYRKRSRQQPRMPTGAVQVLDCNRYVALDQFLRSRMLNTNEPVRDVVMASWWSENGKTFPWARLPTELKELIIMSCMQEQYSNGSSNRYNFTPWIRPRCRSPKRRAACEVSDQLGEWSSLLQVSRQTRTIALRLCFVGSRNLANSEGLAIKVGDLFRLHDCMRRLGKYVQMTDDNSIPVDSGTKYLAKMYKKYPKLYPSLSQYATFRHGLRKICMAMDFLQYLHFFKITTGGFQRYWYRFHENYNIFEQLPNLREVVIKLPDPLVEGMSDHPRQRGPLLFCEDFPCPRTLHRLIFERAAEVLPPNLQVKVCGFMDNFEQQQYEKLRGNAIKAAKLTASDLDELYAEDGGGIELEEPVHLETEVIKSGEETMIPQHVMEASDIFWPPKCRCAVSCEKLLFHQ